MNKRSYSTVILAILITLILLPASVYADFGPKDKVTVYVKNYPDEVYYLDLLQKDDGDYENINPAEYDPEILSHLSSLEDEGWHPALYGGTNIPLFGELTGNAEGDSMVHVFSYFGVPGRFRIIIANKNGVEQVSEEIQRKTLQSSVTIDYFTGEVTIPPVWVSYVLQYISTFIPTILIEGLVLLLLGFSLKGNLPLFIILNAATQLFLTAFAGHSIITGGPTMAFLRFFPHETAILVFETVIYSRFLKGRTEKPKTEERSRKILYGVLANLASWMVSLLMVNSQFQWLMSML